MLCLNYKTKIEFFCWIRSRIEKINGYKKRSCLIHRETASSFEPWALLYFHFMSCSTFVTGSVSYVRAARFVFFQDHFFYTYTNLFPSYCFSDDGTAEQPQECLTTFPVIISFAFLLRLIIYFISVEVQPSAIPDSRLLISLSISFSLPDKLIS